MFVAICVAASHPIICLAIDFRERVSEVKAEPAVFAPKQELDIEFNITNYDVWCAVLD